MVICTPQCSAISWAVISLRRHRKYHSSKSSGISFFRAPNTTPLALAAAIPSAADVFPLTFRHIGQKLEYNVCNQRSCQVSIYAGVQKRHIQHFNVRADFLCNHPPLFQNFRIVAPQPVDAFDNQKIPRL